MVMFGYETPSAALDYLTSRKGPYRWYGVTFFRWFIGFMRSEAK